MNVLCNVVKTLHLSGEIMQLMLMAILIHMDGNNSTGELEFKIKAPPMRTKEKNRACKRKRKEAGGSGSGERIRQVKGKTGVGNMSKSWEAYGRAAQIENVPVYTGTSTRESSSKLSRITTVESEGT
jgi:hypothetical protein